jgi:hypothetical protein
MERKQTSTGIKERSLVEASGGLAACWQDEAALLSLFPVGTPIITKKK